MTNPGARRRSPMEAHLQELDEVGYTTFPGLLSPDEVAEAVAALQRSYA